MPPKQGSKSGSKRSSPQKLYDEKEEGHTFDLHCPSCAKIQTMTPSRTQPRQRELTPPRDMPMGRPIEAVERIILFPETPEEKRKHKKKTKKSSLPFVEDPIEPSYQRVFGGRITEYM